jgi:hypothetical protein
LSGHSMHIGGTCVGQRYLSLIILRRSSLFQWKGRQTDARYSSVNITILLVKTIDKQDISRKLNSMIWANSENICLPCYNLGCKSSCLDSWKSQNRIFCKLRRIWTTRKHAQYSFVENSS